eukprot:5262614-Amphidinium_carterae.1
MALSVWGNELEGRLHDLTVDFQFSCVPIKDQLKRLNPDTEPWRLSTDDSVVLLHGNHFSCGLPRFQSHVPKVSTALVGNHFEQPTKFPPWISELERARWFCVSPKSSLTLSRNFVLEASALVLCYLWRRFLVKPKVARKVASQQHALAKTAWRRTIHVHCLLVLGAF